MDVSALKNGFGMWLVRGIMIVVIVIQALLFLRTARREADHLEISRERQKEGMRSALITAFGPACALVVMCLALMATMGGPNSWMRMADVGSGRSELTVATLVQDMAAAAGGDVETNTFVYGLWAQAVHVGGWLLGPLVMILCMGKVTETMNAKLNPKWMKILMSGALVSLFTYLLTNQVYGKASPYAVAAVFGAACMFLLNKIFAKNRRMQEFSLGISMIVGLLAAVAAKSLMA